MRSAGVTYASALGALAAAVFVRWLLDPWMGDALPFATLFGAVAFAVWIGGYRVAVVVALLGYVGAAYLFIPPRGRIVLGDPAHLVGLTAYLFTCALIIWFGQAARTAVSRTGGQRELLRITLSSIGDAVITTDVAGRVTYLNAVAETLTGWGYHDAAGQPLDTVFHIVHEDTRQRAESPAARALQMGVVVGLANHTVLLRKGGGEFAIDDSAAPIRDDQGRVAGCVLIFRDVTPHRRVERERASQLLTARLLAAIVESSDDAIISKSLDGTIQSWNAAAERLFGHTAEQAIGRHISLVIPSERLAEEDHIVARLRAGQRVDHFETERVRSDGERRFVSLTISPIRDEAGHVIGASKIVRDVTRQRQIEQRERQLLADGAAANAKFQAVFEQGALMAAIADTRGVILEPNRPFWEACGASRDQIVGTPLWHAPLWRESPETVACLQTASERAAAGESFRDEVPYRGADGSAKIALLAIQPIRDDMGRVILLALTGSDVTERKRLEDSLRGLAADLSEADQRKNEFLAMLAHELRNPIAAISNAARALRVGPAGADAVQATSEILERQVGQLARLVDDLLDMSRISRGTIELRRSRVALAAIIDQAVEAARPLCKSLGHELAVALPPHPVHLDADPNRLAQVVGNLLNNACKFSDRGGHITLTVEARDGEAIIRVRDTGIGIAAEHLPRIFDMFAQVDTSLERSRDGLGIGLTLVKTLVELHGGRVEARSDGPGCGSEFEVRVPVAPEPREEPSLPSPMAPAPRAALRVLVVDDNEDGAASLALLLRFNGHDTQTAHDGLAAIALAERFRPDVMLLDIGLPNLNGYEVCRRVRAEPWGRGLVIVALTGWGQDHDRERSREAGFDAHMVKPVDHQALTALLATVASPSD